jgi:hypothetical protein
LTTLAELHKLYRRLVPGVARIDLSGEAADVNGERWVLVGNDRWELKRAEKPGKERKG